MVADQLATTLALGLTGLGQVDIDPPGEQVLLVPVALTVAEQHEGCRHERTSCQQRLAQFDPGCLSGAQEPAVLPVRAAAAERLAAIPAIALGRHHALLADR